MTRSFTVATVCALLFTIAAARPAAAIESRPVLKTYFETGDVPTQEQFADLIDSAIHLVDDGLTTYVLGDSSRLAVRLDAGEVIGTGLAFSPLGDILGFSPEWRSQGGYLPLAFEQDSQLHYGYLQISSPVPGAPNPYSMSVEYLVFEDLANTPLTTQSVPEPASFVLATMGLLALTVYRRRSRRPEN